MIGVGVGGGTMVWRVMRLEWYVLRRCPVTIGCKW